MLLHQKFITFCLERELGLVEKPEERMLKWFEFEHLPAHLQDVSRPFGELAKTVCAEEERQRREGPIELPESLRNASKVLERIQENQKRRCPKCGKVGQMFTADLDWCPACKHQWPGA